MGLSFPAKGLIEGCFCLSDKEICLGGLQDMSILLFYNNSLLVFHLRLGQILR